MAIGNTAYGVASFDGVGTTFTRNAVSGSQDAGLYIGDSLDANAVVSHNRAWDNALGILVRHSQRRSFPTTNPGATVLACSCWPMVRRAAAARPQW